MKTIVVSGGKSGTGKTTLVRGIHELLPGSVRIKIGHGEAKESKGEVFCHLGTPYTQLEADHLDASFLIVESNSILKEITPDLAIYLPADPPKSSAGLAREKADITRGKQIAEAKLETLAVRMGIDNRTINKIAWLAGARPAPATAIILAGGKSTRMGRDKTQLPVNGVTAVQHLADTLRPWFDSVLISVSHDSRVQYGDLKTVSDTQPDHGPLRALCTALRESNSDVNFVIACDIPTIHFPLLFRLLMLSEDSDIVVPSFEEGRYEPLYAVYRKAVAAKAHDVLQKGKRRVAAVFGCCTFHAEYVVDSSWYANLNTPREYKTFVTSEPSAACEIPGRVQ